MKRLLFLIAIAIASFVTPVLAQNQFVFGVIMVGPKNDHGWSQAHYEGGEYVESHFAGSKMLAFESLNTADHPETSLNDVVSEMVDQGAKLIFTTSDEFEEDTDAVAANFPSVTFISVTGSRVLEGLSPSNVGSFDVKMEVTESIAGCAAGLATKTSTIGYLGPLINFETRRLAASAYLGAKHCYEKRGLDPANLKFNVTWIGFWFGIPGVTLDPTEEAGRLFDNGADVVIGALDTSEAVTVAEQRRTGGQDVFSIGYDNAAACDSGPSACLGAPYYNWGPQYTKIAQAVADGSWTSSWDWFDPDYANINNVDTSGAGFSKGPGMTTELSQLLDKYIAEVDAFGINPDNKDAIFLWQGPLNLQDGTVLAKEDENVTPVRKLSDGPSIWYLPQLLEGMTGASESK